MACFTGPVAAALVATAIRHSLKKNDGDDSGKIPFAEKLKWLEKLFLGGSALLAFEHVWHGEIIFTFPFLTAVQDGNTAEMLNEIATVGGAMTGLILLVWLGMVVISDRIVSRAPAPKEA